MPFMLGETALRLKISSAGPAYLAPLKIRRFRALAFRQMALSAMFRFILLFAFGAPVYYAPALVHQLQMLDLVV
jgi:hypothetical protein